MARQFTIRALLIITLLVAIALPVTLSYLPSIKSFLGFSDLAEPGRMHIPKGSEVVIVELPPLEGSTGLIVPGDFVDVLQRKDEKWNKIVRFVSVYSTDYSIRPSKIGLIVTKSESLKTKSAMKSGKLNLVLRGENEVARLKRNLFSATSNTDSN